MDINELLSGELFTKSSLKPISEATETDPSKVATVLTSAVPILLQGMVQNSQTKKGEESLANALSEHANDKSYKSLTTYFKNADTADGAKILKNVLGENTTDITKGLAKQTKVSSTKIKKILSFIAPLLLQLLGSALTNNSNSSEGGLSSLISSFLGGSSLNNSSIGLGDIAGLLLGSSNSSSSNSSGSIASTLLGSLMGSNDSSSSSSSGLGSSLLGSLISGATGSSSQSNSSPDALSLLSSLLLGK